MDPDVNLGDGLHARTLAAGDAPLLVEATSAETEPSLWAGRPLGPYSPRDAQNALSEWDPAARGQFSIGILRGQRLLGAVGLIPDTPGSIELAYWIRPEERRRGIASRAVPAITSWAHHALGIPRIWLEIDPLNKPSLSLAQRVGYHVEQRLPRHCRDWSSNASEQESWHDCVIWTHSSGQTPTTTDQ
jgi:RimJ/RimL family protein N-acetyltransferase